MADDTDAETQSTDPETFAGRTARVARENASELAAETVSMGVFLGLLLMATVLLLVREADLVAFDIPDGLLAALVVVALVVGSAMDTSILPE